MDEDNRTLDSAGDEDVVNPQDEPDQAKDESTPPAGESTGKPAESAEHADNAKMAAARRRGERDAEQRFAERIRSLARINPVTGRPIESLADVEAYFAAQQEQELAAEAKKSGRSVNEIREEREAIARGKSQLQTEREAKRQQEFLAKDMAEFREAHPELELKPLLEDKAFQKFAKARLGKEPLNDIYEDYSEVFEEVKSRATAKAADKADRGTGAGSGTGGGSLSARQKRELEEWNTHFPAMRMTEKEYLEMKM